MSKLIAKTSIIAVATCALLSLNTMAAEAPTEEKVNYGDPTASFTTVGVSTSKDVDQISGMMGVGSNIYQLDLNRDKNTGDFSGRGRYFHVTDGLGYSVDVIGDANTQTILGGMIYKFQLNDNVSIFPMLSVGGTQTKRPLENDKYDRSSLVQAGVYAMYGFDAGHWVYANPKSTYHVKNESFINQVEVGGGLMVTDNISIGAKVEYTAPFDTPQGRMKEDTVTWLQANYYF